VEADTRAYAGGATVVDPVVGHLLDGRYRIGARIARGGMASVYEALDTRLDRTCAVKIMHHGLGDDAAFAERFKREARAAARLSHPNVVNVFDQGEDLTLDGGTVYLVMELVAGHTLRDVIRDEAPMQPVRALALMEPIVSALADLIRYVHGRLSDPPLPAGALPRTAEYRRPAVVAARVPSVYRHVARPRTTGTTGGTISAAGGG